MSVDLPYDTYASLEFSYTAPATNVGGKSIIETISKNRVTNYDYENQLNEERRSINIIKNKYYPQLIAEFDKMTNNIRNASMRRLT
jgi:mannosyltransferase OCH1-like enzyme